ncbi:hypothetical protein MycrhDRAFT_2233 [Mycolicibacterium rhodesiae JS60]|nr:hypothetical protein MycrhDRAFT_2233 [Mycolicibacterium rhodesiae JS60]
MTGWRISFSRAASSPRIMAWQAAFRDAMRIAVGGPGMLDTLIEAAYGPSPTLDQHFAV